MCAYKLTRGLLLGAIAATLVCTGVKSGPCEEIKFPCVPKTQYADPQNCEKYYKCSKAGSRLRHVDCPASQKFDSRSRTCTGDVTASCAAPCPDRTSVKPTPEKVVKKAAPEPETAAFTSSEDAVKTEGGDENDVTDETTQEMPPADDIKIDDVTEPKKQTTSSSAVTETTTPTSPTTSTASSTTIMATKAVATTKTVTVKETPKLTSSKVVTYVPPKTRPSQNPTGGGGISIDVNITAPEKGSPTSGRRMEPQDTESPAPIGLIVGGVAASFVIIAVIVAVIVVCRKKRQKLSDNEIVKIENPQYRGPSAAPGNGSGPTLVVRNYRFSRDLDLYEGSASLDVSTNSITRSEARSKKRRAPPPPNPFGNDEDDEEKPMVEMTTFMEKPPPKPPRQNSFNQNGDRDGGNGAEADEISGADTSQPLLSKRGSGKDTEAEMPAPPSGSHDTQPGSPVTGQNRNEAEDEQWDEYDRQYNPFAS